MPRCARRTSLRLASATAAPCCPCRQGGGGGAGSSVRLGAALAQPLLRACVVQCSRIELPSLPISSSIWCHARLLLPLPQPNERALLTMLVARLRQIDADVFVGHNFAAFDLDVLLHRLQHHKVRGGRLVRWPWAVQQGRAAAGLAKAMLPQFGCLCSSSRLKHVPCYPTAPPLRRCPTGAASAASSAAASPTWGAAATSLAAAPAPACCQARVKESRTRAVPSARLCLCL